MDRIISDFRGSISYLVFSDTGLDGRLKFGAWKLKLARSVFMSFMQMGLPDHMLPMIRVQLDGLSEAFNTESGWRSFEQNWRDKAGNLGNAAIHGLDGDQIQEGLPMLDLLPEIEAFSVDGFDESRFIRDHFLVIEREPFPLILDNHASKTVDGGIQHNPVLSTLLDEFDHEVKAAELNLEGGDILVADNLVLVGPKTVKAHGGMEVNALRTKLYTIFGKDVLFVKTGLGSYPDQLYHIDLYLTLLGEDQHGIDLAIGRVHTWDGCNWTEVLTDPMAKALQGYLDLVRIVLPSNQFRIVEWPLLWDNAGGQGRLYSYNNCLVEYNSGGKPRLILPSYAAEMTDFKKIKFEAADQKFIDCNPAAYELEWIMCNFHDEVIAKASLRCLTQVLRRTTG